MELIWLEVGSYSAFLRVKSEWKALSPPPPPKPVIPEKTSDQNFKRSILFSIVERSSKYVFGDVNLATVLRTRAGSCSLLTQYIKKGMQVWTSLSMRTKGIQMRLPENVEGSVELSQTTICVYGLSKGCNTGIAEYTNLENSGNDKEIWSKRQYLHATNTTTATTTATTTTLLHLQYGEEIWSKSKDTMCMHIVKIAYLKNRFWVLSWNFQRMLKGEDHLTKRQHVYNTTITTATATFPTATTTSIATTCKAKSIGMQITRSIWIYR